MTYKVIDYNGDVIARGLSAAEAANEILSTDSREWEIRRMEGGGWQIWSRQQVANRPWAATVVTSFAGTLEKAQQQMFEEVIARNFRHHYQAVKENKCILNGRAVDFDEAAHMMDEEIRESLHSKFDNDEQQEFMDAYVARHFAKYGEDFIL